MHDGYGVHGVRFIDQQQCWNEADKFRQQYWPSGEIPVDVLAIVEFDLNLEIRVSTGLKEDADVDALLLGDWKTALFYHPRDITETSSTPRGVVGFPHPYPVVSLRSTTG